ncbi:uncharacterized protein LOC126834902 [Adelges cooleyi]|uniref:uncharacterized protein LOC126834902 n=1 Tax=Adelges cooleyi TaxID=133065 RepID=UPI00217F970B|nr:uncharacterized protein LOC126834902 [Adelges cooleyi]
MAGCPARTLLLLACALWPPVLVRTNDGQQQQQQQQEFNKLTGPWCPRPECVCTVQPNRLDNRLGMECTYTGSKNITLEPENMEKLRSLSSIRLTGDGDTSITFIGRTFAQTTNLTMLVVSGFAEFTVKKDGLLIKNKDVGEITLNVEIDRVQKVYLDTNAIQLQAGTVDVTIRDCGTVRLSEKIVSKLKTFTFLRIGSLEMSKGTFEEAAVGAIEQITLDNVFLGTIPSSAFVTSISSLTMRNCSINLISREAFPKNMFNSATLTDVTIGKIENQAFRESTFMNALRLTRCRVQDLDKGAFTAIVNDIVIEQSEFGTIESGAVVVTYNMSLINNTFGRVMAHGFTLANWHEVVVQANVFEVFEPEAFFESNAQPAAGSSSSAVVVSTHLTFDNNTLGRVPGNGTAWTPIVRLKTAANMMRVMYNRVSVVTCNCTEPMVFVTIDADGSDESAGRERQFLENNYCRVDAAVSGCAKNLTADDVGYAGAAEFRAIVRCESKLLAGVFDRCVLDQRDVKTVDLDSNFRMFGTFMGPKAERGVITTLVLLILCGFGAVCAVSAITWLNARGYFIKLRSLLTPGGISGGRSAGNLGRTTSAHSLSPISVHEYAELQRNRTGRSANDYNGGSMAPAVRVVVFQDRGTQTVPEELTQEMLQTLRDKLDDPEDYAEARDMIEHLYDLIRVEETCCGNGGIDWYGGLDDITSTTTTKAIIVGGPDGTYSGDGRRRVSVGIDAPSLEKLWPPKVTASNRKYSRPPQPPPMAVGDEYMDPADLYAELQRNDAAGDTSSEAHIYCELPN